MGRRKQYFEWEIPTTVVEIVRVHCIDYNRRERAIKYSAITGAVLAKYVELNAVIDNALSEVEAGIRSFMMDDIQNNRGYDFSRANICIGKNTYYRRKRKLIHDIAEGYALI